MSCDVESVADCHECWAEFFDMEELVLPVAQTRFWANSGELVEDWLCPWCKNSVDVVVALAVDAVDEAGLSGVVSAGPAVPYAAVAGAGAS